jgi:proteic killer suppression protein
MPHDPEFPAQGLAAVWTKSDESGLRPDWIKKVDRLLRALDAAKRPEDLAIPGAGWHALHGDRKGHYALIVSRNWRLTFGWDGEDAIAINLEDYHG